MMKPTIPSDEKERLKSLESSHQLYTPIAQSFERLVDLTKKIFDVPLVGISFINKKEQWFKASIGFEGDMDRNRSFCSYTILNDDVMVIPDAKQDHRFIDSPYVLGPPMIRFYAGCPIHINNARIGTICIADRKPRQLSLIDKLILLDMASIIDTEIQNQLFLHENEQKLYRLSSRSRNHYLDPITKLWTKEALQQIIEQQFFLSKKANVPFGLIYLSINGFQSFVTEHGENVGYDLLKGLAKLIVHNCDTENSVGFWGGKELMIVVPNSSTVQSAAERIIRHLQEEHILTRIGPIKITAAIGIACSNELTHNTEDIIAKVSQALERAKHQGGNRIVTADIIQKSASA